MASLHIAANKLPVKEEKIPREKVKRTVGK
jgi:hypothetical protein